MTRKSSTSKNSPVLHSNKIVSTPFEHEEVEQRKVEIRQINDRANIKYMFELVNVKLNKTNYIDWKAQINSLISALDVTGILENDEENVFLKSEKSLILLGILSTIEPATRVTIKCTTDLAKMWSELNSKFAVPDTVASEERIVKEILTLGNGHRIDETAFLIRLSALKLDLENIKENLIERIMKVLLIVGIKTDESLMILNNSITMNGDEVGSDELIDHLRNNITYG